MSDLSSAGSAPASPESERDEAARNTQLNGSDDSDEEVTTARKSRKHVAPMDEDDESDVAMKQDDLFGDGSGSDGGQSPKRRKLSDSELDSGDDDGRKDRMEEDVEEHQEESLRIIDYDLDRHGIPRSSDGEFYLLRFPQSMGIDPIQFIPETFKKPTKAHHGAPPSSGFSAAQIANTTIRWRRSPNDPAKLQSNARVVRWSDGSLTLQMAATPLDQFELPAKALAAPQIRPIKPTPISDPKKPIKYDARADSHTYLASVYPAHNLAQITNHVTASLTIETTGDEADEALIRLQEQLSAAVKGSKGEGGRGPEIVTLTEDPELARKRAEAAERDRARADRRRQNQQEKERDRAARVMGRPTGRSGGLTIGGLEDDEGGADTRRRAKTQRNKPRRRNSEYSDDEEEGYGRRGGKEDEYDKDDGFLVESDEDLEAEDDSEEEDEFGEVDADGEEEEGTRSAPAKEKVVAAQATATTEEGTRNSRRRRVVDDDEDDE